MDKRKRINKEQAQFGGEELRIFMVPMSN